MSRPSRLTVAFVAAVLLIAPPAFARRGGHASYHSYASHSGHPSTYSTVAPRNSHGRIKRSSSAKREFEKETGYPHGRPGYVVDHVVPLKRGGADAPGNMQWQTKEAAKAKDKWE